MNNKMKEIKFPTIFDPVAIFTNPNYFLKKEDVNFIESRRFEYAYVIYDLNHRKNIDLIKNYFNNQEIKLCGRFGEFEYLNMDAVIKHSEVLACKIQRALLKI